MPPNRKGKLHHQFKQTIEGKEDIVTLPKAKLFLEAIQSEEDPSTCISQLISSSHGVTAVQHALRIDTTSTFINNTAIGFLTYIQDQNLAVIANGSCLKTITTALVDPPIFWDAFIWALESKKLGSDAEHAFAWLLLQLISLPKQKAAPYITLAKRPSIQKALWTAPLPTTQNIMQKINQILSTIDTPIDLGSNGPGGRHDNDFEEFRNIAILPTIDEIASQEAPFLRFLSEVESHTDSTRFSTHLDNQFRLLREDMLHDLREDIATVLNPTKSRRHAHVINDLRLLGIDCDTRRGWNIVLQCKEDLAFLPKEDRSQFLEKNRKWFAHDSLAVLLVSGKIIGLGTILRKVPEMSQKPPILHLKLPDAEHAIRRTLTEIRSVTDISMVQLNTAIFAYEPILRQLQNIKFLPLANQIVDWKADQPSLEHQPKLPKLSDLILRLQKDYSQDLRQLVELPKTVKLDANQAQSLITALTQRLAIVQGPPGTGKSFIGALIATILFKITGYKILVLSYTNHALDQCLEDFIDMGIPKTDMVRLGSKAKMKDRIQSLALSEQNSDAHRLRRPDVEMIIAAKAKAADMSNKLDREFRNYNRPSATRQEIMQHLEFSTEFDSFYEDFQVPTQADGFEIVDKKGDAIKMDYLFDRWACGRDRGVLRDQAYQAASDAWTMTFEERLTLLRTWKNDILAERLANIVDYGTQFRQTISDIADIYSKKDIGVMKDKRIIGCTTTAAAKYVKEIQSAAPDVVIVEEAGEILESHLLTAIGPETKQLILIGDHKQLRPKAHYDLSVEKGTGYDLNRSLFERLVLKGYPHQTLLQQHRMRPEISSLVRALTYPELRDAESTLDRPILKGFQSNVIFANHSVPELDVAGARDPRDPTSRGSKENQFEAEMTLKCVKYLAQQGYRSDQVVILTPYLGQLRLLFDTLSRENDPILNDMDSHDLVRTGLMPQASAKVQNNRLRISTIDNYQGEESDVVVVSLTRSNPKGDIGFLQAPERLNVLLSRARNGLIVLGNASTFTSARKGQQIWSKFLRMLKENMHVYEGFPVHCERHPHRKSVLTNPDDFDIVCPDGGCDQPCQSILSCGIHTCPRRCHQIVDHSKVSCKHYVTDTCNFGHTLSWRCHKKKPIVCPVCEEIKREDERRRVEAFEAAREQEKAKQQHDDLMKAVEIQIQARQSQVRDARLQVQRQDAYEQKMLDLQNIEDLATQVTRLTTEDTKKLISATPQMSPNYELDPKSKPEPEPKTAETVEDQCKIQSPAILSVPELFAELEWERIKTCEKVSSTAMDAMMRMTGLQDVKQQFIDIFHKISTQKRQGTDLSQERLGVVLLGNPGTGKTTVARQFAKLLWQFQAVPGDAFVETSGAKLSNSGAAAAQKLIDDLVARGGGVVFVDEAYQLVSKSQFGGGAVLDLLLAEIENRVGTLVFIFAGYTRQMEKFFEHNPGLNSRLPNRLHFADYSEAELLHMLKRKIQDKYKGLMKIENGFGGLYLRIVVRRLHRRSGREGFGNARDLENVLDKIMTAQSRRLAIDRAAGRKPDDFLLTKEDLIGPEPSKVLRSNESWRKLSDMIGLRAVKNNVRVLFDRLQQNYQLELQEAPMISVSLNRLFLGSPGTGKTSVAKLYGQILADLGLLSSSELVLKTPADFVSDRIGGSERNTKSILDAARGKVLVIDEAYMFGANSNKDSLSTKMDPFRTAIIDTIVSEVQSTPGEDRAVLLLGYKQQMEDMLRDVNPGLARRFPVDNAFTFENFDDDDLRKILHQKMKEQGLQASSIAIDTALTLLTQLRRQPNFGNAGEVQNLLGRAIDRWSARRSDLAPEFNDPLIVLEPVDFDPEYDRRNNAIQNCIQLFEGVIGCEAIVDKLCGYISTSINAQKMDLKPEDLLPFNFVFKGPPGTGKTTTARKIGRIFCDLGFLKSDTVIECSATDLVGSYVGHTGPKVLKKLDEALGQVLFIDEAYRLREGHFAKEAIDELVDSLSKPRYKSKLLVILAGYDAEINDLLQVNPGLSSRFPEEINFKNLTPKDCFDIVRKRLAKSPIPLQISRNDEEDIQKAFPTLMRLSGWANGRDVETVTKRTLAKAIEQGASTITSEQICDQITLLHGERLARAALSDSNTKSAQPFKIQDLSQSSPSKILGFTPSTDATGKRKSSDGSPPEKPDGNDPCGQIPQRDAGVTDEVWRQLEADRMAHEAEERTREQLIAKLAKIEQNSNRSVEEIQDSLKQIQDEASPDDAKGLKEERLRIALVAAKRAADEKAEQARKAREEAAERKKQEAKAQEKLREMGVCIMGFRWIKQRGGYRCAGGSHFVDNAALGA